MYNLPVSQARAPNSFPEKKIPSPGLAQHFLHQYPAWWLKKISSRASGFQKIISQVKPYADQYRNLSQPRLAQEVQELRLEIRKNGLTPQSVARSFALIREQAGRCLDTRHYDEQLVGGLILFKGMAAEMETGEGKTLTATLPACTAALAGIPVHIITVNEYLARRDAAWMRPVYEAMGLTVGAIKKGMSLEQRRDIYRSDVVYCTNKELVFDYLKDHLMFKKRPGRIASPLHRLYGPRTLERLCISGLFFAIIDEVDSVLIDEARTPLVISRPGNNRYQEEVFRRALDFAGRMTPGSDFLHEVRDKQITLTEAGKKLSAEIGDRAGGLWTIPARRDFFVKQALAALHLYKRDKDYLVTEGRVVIVDPHTGRVMADRSWEKGLHQMLEYKEGCALTVERETLARISYQRFFRRYHHLAGMTGTAGEVAHELWTVYGLHVVAVPTHRPLRRRKEKELFFVTEKEKLHRIVRDAAAIHATGRPILIGTPTVAASESLSALLRANSLPHTVLNARQDQQEAEIIAKAGQSGQITIATNMAGRGTDIALGPGVAESGGLHVIATERHSAGRIDRQLFGRCGRQGDPGSCAGYVSLGDTLLAPHAEGILGKLMRFLARWDTPAGGWLIERIVTRIQRSLEKRHFYQRCRLLSHDDSVDQALAFTGERE